MIILCKAFTIIIFFCSPSFACLARDGEPENDKLLKQAEQLLDHYKDSEALVVYEQIIETSADNYVALCKASYLHCRIGYRFTDQTKKLEHIAKGRQLAKRAYALQPEDAESNYVMALSIACQAMISGPKDRLVGINQVKSFVDASLAANPEHAGSWHLLGRWYFKMANLNFAEKAASKMLFGGVCGMYTNQDAAEAVSKAILYNPNNIQYYYDLALIYNEMKDNQSCLNTLNTALTLTLGTKEELEISRRCKIMLQEKKNS